MIRIHTASQWANNPSIWYLNYNCKSHWMQWIVEEMKCFNRQIDVQASFHYIKMVSSSSSWPSIELFIALMHQERYEKISHWKFRKKSLICSKQDKIAIILQFESLTRFTTSDCIIYNRISSFQAIEEICCFLHLGPN